LFGSLRVVHVVAAVGILLASPLPVLAADSIYLDWNLCGPAGPATQGSSCNTNVGSQKLYCAFRLESTVDQVLGVEIVIDVSHSDATLPPWWQLGVGGCRYGALTADGGTPDGPDCTEFWGGQQTGGIQGYAVGQPRGGANQARIKVALSLLPGNSRTLLAGTLYYAARVVLGNQLTVGSPSCSGCGDDACLVLNSIWIKRVPGALGGDLFLSTPGVDGSNQATWQGATANCAAVPVRPTSWGRIKSLYR
jgi:hypothetical protein